MGKRERESPETRLVERAATTGKRESLGIKVV